MEALYSMAELEYFIIEDSRHHQVRDMIKMQQMVYHIKNLNN
jgi:hypothetical protein